MKKLQVTPEKLFVLPSYAESKARIDDDIEVPITWLRKGPRSFRFGNRLIDDEASHRLDYVDDVAEESDKETCSSQRSGLDGDSESSTDSSDT